MNDEAKAIEVTKHPFTLMSVKIRTDSEGRQHFSHFLHIRDNPDRIESIPWGEIMGRKITGLSMEDGHLIIGLSTKD